MSLFGFITRNLSDETLECLEEKTRDKVNRLESKPKSQVKVDLHRIDIINELEE